ncbi:alpha-N-acetylglucosaminidase C-terminal domain-containing protein [Elizabethkingia sp. JS20170427COW]|uniref:alpha-N-acetylglucosaminidase C-terminal domain-containing protein n=1 Tax=Elizabethkingia sp. JS20170427COW TaxID=2583851 RepID=UPI00272B4CCD|nr:alpha-N-acetylglucosaminidase C-terminal domain-containing protein [Elizabethkingia sp. JS20170427COW]
MSAVGSKFLAMIKLQDELLSYSPYFTLNRWLQQAENYAENLPDKDLALYNAKAQITFWGPDDYPKTSLRDYAHKEWKGLLGSLYTQRWKLFIQNAEQGKFTAPQEFYKMEVQWAKSPEIYPVSTQQTRKLEEIANIILK